MIVEKMTSVPQPKFSYFFLSESHDNKTTAIGEEGSDGAGHDSPVESQNTSSLFQHYREPLSQSEFATSITTLHL